MAKHGGFIDEGLAIPYRKQVVEQGLGLASLFQRDLVLVALDRERARLGGRIPGADKAGIVWPAELLLPRLLVEVQF